MDTAIRQMQLEIIKMMEELDNLLNENGIKYTLLGGSVLGAVRHKGFIPWDDDMDIGIWREDFDKAENLLLNFKPYIYETVEKHVIPGAPIGHLHLVTENYPIENSPTIDVFPLDIVPESEKERKKLRTIANIYHACIVRRPPQNRGVLRKVLFTIVFSIFPYNFWVKLQKKQLNKILSYRESNSNYIGNIFGAWFEKEYFKKEIYENLERSQFENLLLPIPKNFDVYLTQMYGNYMELPPVEKRVPKHREFQD